MKKLYEVAIIVVSLLACSGCGNGEDSKLSMDESAQFTSINDISKDSSNKGDETKKSSDKDTMYVYSESDTLKDYNTVADLLDDACILGKVKVLQADSANVRSYIYTAYNMEVLDVLYGEIDENVITVNMPGGIIEGDEAQEMISEVTDGKDAGDLANIGSVVSDGNTDRLLAVGDEAYLFLMPESDTAYAVVGEYNGEILLENGNVLFDANIVGFQEGVSVYGLSNGSVTESEFIEAMGELIPANN